MKKPSKSYEIALSAIACAFAAICLTVGTYVDVLLAMGYILAVFALMLPLSKQFVWGGALSFVAASLLAFLFNIGAFFKLVPFIMFLGIHPLLNFLQKKYVKRKLLHGLAFLLKAAWFDGMLCFFWFVLAVPVFGVNELYFYPTIVKYVWYLIFIGGTLLFAAYDYMIFLCQRSVNAIVRRFGR